MRSTNFSVVTLSILALLTACGGEEGNNPTPFTSGGPPPSTDGNGSVPEVADPAPGIEGTPAENDDPNLPPAGGSIPEQQTDVPLQPADVTPPAGGGGDNQPPVAEEPGQNPAEEAPPENEAPPEDEVSPPVGTFVENSGQDCQIPALPAANNLPNSAQLPNPFVGLDGQAVTTREQWRCRRQEILRLAERFILGEKALPPESVSGAVSTTNITVNVSNQGQSGQFSAAINYPANVTGPVPAVIGFGGSNFQDTILEEGVAYINFSSNNQVGSEMNNTGIFYNLNPGQARAGALVAWAWGVSRMIDVIEQSGSTLINPQAIGVHGCSRSGKGALIAGAFDERVALTIPFESGTMGAPIFRGLAAENAESPQAAYGAGRWAGQDFMPFFQSVNTLPIDSHEILGLVAPRGLMVIGNPHIPNLGPRAEHVSVVAAAEIYEALGAQQNISYTSNAQEGAHCAFRQEYVAPLQQSIRKFLKGDANATTGAIDPRPQNGLGNPGAVINWQTPTLQ